MEYYFGLIDTAGIRDHTSDTIEKIGVERSREKMRKADVVVYLFDVAGENISDFRLAISDLENRGLTYLLVGNKVDMIGDEKAREKFSGNGGIIFISAKEDKHIDVLKERLGRYSTGRKDKF